MSIIKNIKLPNSSEYPVAIFRGTCSTAAATAAKVVTCAYFESADLVKGSVILITFNSTNTAAVANLSLNVNGTGAKYIKKQYNNTISNLTSAAELLANETYMFQYDGTYWVCMNLDWNSTYTINNGVLTINQNGTSVGTFSANQSTNTTINIDTKTYWIELS